MPEQYIGAPAGARFASARAGSGDGAIIVWAPAVTEPTSPDPAGWKRLGDLPPWVAQEAAAESRLTVSTAGMMAVRISVVVSVPVNLRGLEHEVYAMGFSDLSLGPPPIGAIKPAKWDPQIFLRTQRWRWVVGWHDANTVTGWASTLAPAVAGGIGPEFNAELAGQEEGYERFRLVATWGISAPATIPPALTIQLGEDRRAPHPKTIRPVGWKFGELVAWGLGR